MNLAIFGGGGRTGKRVVELALKRGDQIRALLRDQASLPGHAKLHVVTGDARDVNAIAQALSNTDAVLCCLGLADISRPTTAFSDAVRLIVDAMKRTGPRRIVAIGSASALPDARGGLRLDHASGGPYRHINAEHGRNYATLRDSTLDWTLVCPVDLKDDIASGHARTAIEGLPDGSAETGYDDLAMTMLALVHDRDAYRKRIGVISVR
ncbi:MAG TPA: NAD(P)H-binding protein [Casimicrobiaceae bacterium]|nr:NAD(P)H-binding protein [Casimicrobiaceae bacterium]